MMVVVAVVMAAVFFIAPLAFGALEELQIDPLPSLAFPFSPIATHTNTETPHSFSVGNRCMCV